jgi:hypothetical protein
MIALPGRIGEFTVLGGRTRLHSYGPEVSEHGFAADPSSQLVLLCNPVEAERITSFRAGVESATGIVAKHDFIPSTGAPELYAPQEIVGQRAPEKLNGLKLPDRMARCGLSCSMTFLRILGLREHVRHQQPIRSRSARGCALSIAIDRPGTFAMK